MQGKQQASHRIINNKSCLDSIGLILPTSDFMLMCRSWIILTSIASLTNDLSVAFSVDSSSSAGAGARHLGWRRRRRRRRGNEELLTSSTSINSESDVVECALYEWTKRSDTFNNHGFTAQAFASSNCWGCRPLLFKGAFDPTLLLCRGDEDDADVDIRDDSSITYAWPSWEDVVEIAADVDSESR